MAEQVEEQLSRLAAATSADERLEALMVLSRQAIDAEEWRDAISLTCAALEAARQTGSDRALANARSMHSAVLWETGELTEAAAGYLDAARLYAGLALGTDSGMSYLRAAQAMCDDGLHNGAMQFAERAIQAFANEGYSDELPQALLNLSDRLSFAQRHDEALGLTRAAFEVAEAGADDEQTAHAKQHEAQVLWRADQRDEALKLVDAMTSAAMANRNHQSVCEWVAIAADFLLWSGDHAQTRRVIAATLERHLDDIPPWLLSDLMFFDARALWALGDQDAAEERFGEAQGLLIHHGDDVPESAMRRQSALFVHAAWMAESRRWPEAEADSRALLAQAGPSVRPYHANQLAQALLEQQRQQEALEVLDSTHDEDPETMPLGGGEWMWRQVLRSIALRELGHWQEADAIAKCAVACAVPEVPGSYLGELWDTRAMAALETDLDLSSRWFEQALLAYRSDNDELGARRSLNNLMNVAVLASAKGGHEVGTN